MIPGFAGNMRMALAEDKKDPYWSSVRMLLRNLGPDGSNTFVDEGSLGGTLNAIGDAKLSSADFKFGGTSARFDGNGDYVLPAATGSNLIGVISTCTVEFWAKADVGQVANASIIDLRDASTGYSPYFRLNSGNLQVFTSQAQRWAVPFSDSVWHHVAFTKTGSTCRLFIDGVKQGSDYTGSVSTYNDSRFTMGAPIDGRTANTNAKFAGYIDSFRLTMGVARYSASFTVDDFLFPNK